MKAENVSTGIVIPQAIGGFPEWLPQEKILEQKMLDIIRSGYERFGFVPIETPAVERKEVLTAKGGNEKEIYALTRLVADENERDDSSSLALHFDLTVPLARYVAQHHRELAFPFRRYQMQKVWRGERPQAGRFREFYQCDIDVIGDEELSPMTDAEIPSIIYQIFTEMNIGPFLIRINNRKVLQGYFASQGIPREKQSLAMRVVDKLEKIGVSQVITELVETVNISEMVARLVVEFVDRKVSSKSVSEELLSICTDDLYREGVKELEAVINGIRALGVPDSNFQIDLGIARGLDYYTGTVYETTLVNHPGIGSICSGGRYDDLASHFIDRKLPGVGISIGVTRLLSKLITAGVLKAEVATMAPVLITSLDGTRMFDYLRLASTLRESGVNAEVYLESKKIGVQLRYANRKGFFLAVIAGSVEFEKSIVLLKNLKTGDQQEVVMSDLTGVIKNLLQ